MLDQPSQSSASYVSLIFGDESCDKIYLYFRVGVTILPGMSVLLQVSVGRDSTQFIWTYS